MTRSWRTRNLAKPISATILIILVAGFFWEIRSISRPGGSVSGTIVDTTGSAISGASVILKNVDNGFVSKRTLSETESSFHLARIPPGKYVIQISKATFDEFESAPIAVGPYTAANFGQIVLDFPPVSGLDISDVAVEKRSKTPIVVGRVVDRDSHPSGASEAVSAQSSHVCLGAFHACQARRLGGSEEILAGRETSHKTSDRGAIGQATPEKSC